jgi:microcystin-dependent protein
MPAEPFIGNIILFAGNYAPAGWAFCDGSSVSIENYDALYNLIGTTYGGDGTTSFNLPDLRGRAPIHQDQNFVLGQAGGAEQVTLQTSQLPVHTHLLGSGQPATTVSPTGNPTAVAAINTYNPTSDGPMAAGTVGAFGGNQSHENRQPSLALNYIIALDGVYPSPS